MHTLSIQNLILQKTLLLSPLKLISGLLIASMFCLLASTATANDSTDQAKFAEMPISGPYKHKNLSIFLFHDQSAITTADLANTPDFVTLGEAMKTKQVTVFETGNVSELAIENTGDKPIFIQSGDIVKGGKQDRVIQKDLVLEPHSGRVPIGSFCVESGRWSKRAGESVQAFSSSGKHVSSRELKLAAKHNSSQSKVWQEVANTQNKLADKIGTDVKDQRSQSSLQLALENKAVTQSINGYVTSLKNIAQPTSPSKSRVTDWTNIKPAIGYAAVIDGKIISADIYATPQLFKKLWPKMLEATATEAVATPSEIKKQASISSKDIKQWVMDNERNAPSQNETQLSTERYTKEDDSTVGFGTVYEDKNANSKYNVRYNLIKK